MRAVSIIVAVSVILLAAQSACAQENQQWIVLGTDAARSFDVNLSVLDAGSGQHETRFAVVESVNGRTVALLDPAVESLLHRVMHAAHHRCGGYTVHPSREAALAEATNSHYARGAAPLVPFPRTIDQQAHVRPALDRVNAGQVMATVRRLQALDTRYYQSQSGQIAAHDIRRQWDEYGIGRSDFSTSLYNHAWSQNSVIATIRGVELPNEIVVIGAHLDSINPRDQTTAPGADDNATGIAVVSEVLRVILSSGFKPKRTLQFMAYAAEEVGLRGSRDIATAYRNEGKQVIAALQMDMTGYAGSPNDTYFITDYVSADLTEFLKELIGVYNGPGDHRISYGETACGYACSDHVSWTGTGVAAAFPFEARFEDYNPRIHTANDSVTNLDSSGGHQVRFAKLGVEYMMELGKNATDPSPAPIRDQYLYTTLRIISSSASRGCSNSDWNCMTQLCQTDLGSTAWRGWAGCYRDGSNFQCLFECGAVRRFL